MLTKLGRILWQGVFSAFIAIIVLSVSGFQDLAQAVVSCDTTNYTGFFLGPDNRTTYAITSAAMSWEAANTLVKSSGGQLATITSAAENAAIATNLGSYFTPIAAPSSGNKAWIGLYDPANSGYWCMQGQPCTPVPSRFVWSAGASAFSNYSSGQPDDLCTTAEKAENPDSLCYGEPWVAMSQSGGWSDEGDHGTTPVTLPAVAEWSGQTLSCVQNTTPPDPAPPETFTGLFCTDSNMMNLAECQPTSDNGVICPLGQSACVPTCQTGFTWNATLSKCTVSACQQGTFNPASQMCEVKSAPQNTTGYAVQSAGSCPSGFATGTPPTSPECTAIEAQWGSSSGITDCSNPSQYNCISQSQVQACSAGSTLSGQNCITSSAPSCSVGTLNTASGLCTEDGGTAACPSDAALPCKTIQGDTSGATYCAAGQCKSSTDGWTQSLDGPSGGNDKQNDGTIDNAGNCLGTVYIFNGTDTRCRQKDLHGMFAAYAKLVAQIVLACTGVGAALAAAIGAVGAMATAVVNAVIQVAVNTAIDAATGQLTTSSLITSGLQVIAAGMGGALSSASWGDSIANAMAGTASNTSTTWGSIVLNSTYEQYAQELGNTVQQFEPAISQGMFGNYSETKCCYPDKLSASCENNEIKEWQEQKGRLCHVVGSYCSSKMLFICMTTKQTSCCFSSVLARIIQEQGRKQLTAFTDGNFGGPKDPICRGFTPAEFESLNFSIMDFSEYIDDLQGQMQTVAPLLTNYMTEVGQSATNQLHTTP